MRFRRGVTLIELLVVILIMLMITAITIPVVAPAINGRKTRETARLIDTFIAGAKARARRTGRPVGVSFEMMPENPSACQTLRYAEVPPPYSGDQTSSTITISDSRGGIGGFPSGDSGWLNRVRPGDLIQFAYRSRQYRLYAGEPYVDINANGVWDSGIDPFVDLDASGAWTPPQSGVVGPNGYFAIGPSSTNPDWTFAPADEAEALSEILNGGAVYGSSGVSSAFQIIPSPTVLAAGILQLPQGVAVDMGWADTTQSPAVVYPGSGVNISDGATFLPNLSPALPPYANRVIVTFNPDGVLDRIYSTAWNGSAANPGWLPWQGRQNSGEVYFLVGDMTKIGGDPAAGQGEPKYNFQDAASLIVAINPSTGTTTVARNVAPDMTASIQSQLIQSRSAAREGVSMESR